MHRLMYILHISIYRVIKQFFKSAKKKKKKKFYIFFYLLYKKKKKKKDYRIYYKMIDRIIIVTSVNYITVYTYIIYIFFHFSIIFNWYM